MDTSQLIHANTNQSASTDTLHFRVELDGRDVDVGAIWTAYYLHNRDTGERLCEGFEIYSIHWTIGDIRGNELTVEECEDAGDVYRRVVHMLEKLTGAPWIGATETTTQQHV
jgi:hypothetical protein